ncbi:DEAD/DEAH box helicase [Halalkalibacterium ligniniphilum]|uniref:DEAD/DEAH box helicase n=1 Tax=Halalkalibacterium ligniniphilum TaxID=1134413 RepID=UPI00034C68E2|nr:DEAD/DEAH box helicase [Halalkalibacterium ligniniphilum]
MEFVILSRKIIPASLESFSLSTPRYRIDELPSLYPQPFQKSFPFSLELHAFLTGRLLKRRELPFPLPLIQQHYEHGFLQYEPAIAIKNDGRPVCKRCGNEKAHLFATIECFHCKRDCTYCRSCIKLGRITACEPLVRWTGPEWQYPLYDDPLSWTGTLSPGQKHASDLAVEAVRQQTKLLIWAVCGSGKTEVVFAPIAEALKKGGRVLLATPRTDVVKELFPRLKKAFPVAKITALYGGSEEVFHPAQLVLATTHQVLRFKQAFDLVIIDEVDAFPYTMDKRLQFAVEEARRAESPLLSLTATPSKQLLSTSPSLVKIPLRYHGFPLPVPTFSWCGNWRKRLRKNKLPPKLIQWLTERQPLKTPVFVFVPSIKILNEVGRLLLKENIPCETVHGEDATRHEKIERFRKGENSLLVTTTILERGVTIPNVEVAVLGAEDTVFSESALVQIAGRVGRSASSPSGEVVFFHYGKSDQMVKARRHIQKMNEEGKRFGLLSIM